jgi:hypothetical protein
MIQVEHRGHRDTLCVTPDQLECISAADEPFFQGAHVETASAGFAGENPEVGNTRQLVEGAAGIPGRSHLHERLPGTEHVADADLPFPRAFHREILAERAIPQFQPVGFPPPGVVLRDVDTGGAVFPAVMAPIRLPVSFEALEPQARGFHLGLRSAGEDHAVPYHLRPRQSDKDGDDCHCTRLPYRGR